MRGEEKKRSISISKDELASKISLSVSFHTDILTSLIKICRQPMTHIHGECSRLRPSCFLSSLKTNKYMCKPE